MAMSNYETPKRFTAINDVTGKLIVSKSSTDTAYANGWDAIWGKKEVEEVSQEEIIELDKH